MVFSIQSSTSVEIQRLSTKTMLSELQLPEEESCGMIDCPTENRMGSNVDLNTSLRCVCPRKRKEHDDVAEHDYKFSKSSPVDNPVSLFMRKWTESPMTTEKNTKETLKEQKSSSNEQIGMWSWMQRQRHDSFKENEPMQEEQADKCYTIKGRFSICENESMSLSEKHFESSYNLPERRSSSKSSPKRSRSKQMSKKLSVLKMKIESSEEEFQRRMGYRPSHADKMKDEELSNLINEHTKLKQELKSIKDLGEDSPRKKSFEEQRTVEQERDLIILNLDNIRLRCLRPYDLDKMTTDQIADEKRDMQSQLLEFEKVHGHTLNKSDKDNMANLYERFRLVKRQSRRLSSELVPIPEEESIALTLASPKHRMSTDLSNSFFEIQENEIVSIISSKKLVFETDEKNDEQASDDENWHTMTFSELNNNLKRLREDKKVFKRSINEFEGKFQTTTGRKVQGEDKQPLENTYLMYRVTKSKIKLIKALIEKHVK
eukprot:GFUD01011410.1.p1 GENE.GFUD01011410.1~~GFUD01011410.1.p1  ORF type:complete len:488 (+),score=109.52 GFUD01011410.1:557-2020(+)